MAAAGGGDEDGAMWLDVEEVDIENAGLLRVTVTESVSGRGKRAKTSFVCTGTLHTDTTDRLDGYKRAQKKLNRDPTSDETLQQELRQHMMADFRKQKRKREGDNLVDSDGEGLFVCCCLVPAPSSFHTTRR